MEKLKDVKLNKELLAIEPNEKVLYDAIILAQASLRQGTHSTKNRSEVRGGGRKPWRQKGTGHARQGSIRAVQWRKGGTYGGPVPRDYSINMNRKERRLALKSALATKANDGELIVLDSLKLETPKTKEMVAVLNNLQVTDKKVLVVVPEIEENLLFAASNLQNVLLEEVSEINVLDIVTSDYMVVTEDALKQIEEVLA